jgi:peptidoglycan/xylan/chitin deacetylase (PgdA/CDA1 family)
MNTEDVFSRSVRKAERVARQALRPVERRVTTPFGVLAYHRIATPAIDPWTLSVSPSHFDHHLRRIRTVGRTVDVGQACHNSRHSRIGPGPRTLGVTFDDGYLDNLEVALPLLEAHDVPATFFIATALLDRPYFWWDRLADLALGDHADPGEIHQVWNRLTGRNRLPEDLTRTELHSTMYDDAVQAHPDEIHRLLDQIADEFNVPAPDPAARPMTTDELSEFARHPLVAIGDHTAAHRRMTDLTETEARAEIDRGKARLDELLGSKQRLFSYPYGMTNRAVTATVRSAGFGYAFTTQPRWTSLFDRAHTLPRLDVRDLGPDAFDDWLESS